MAPDRATGLHKSQWFQSNQLSIDLLLLQVPASKMSFGANMLLLWRKPRIFLVCAAAACGGLLFGYDLGEPPSQSSCCSVIDWGFLKHCEGRRLSAIENAVQDLGSSVSDWVGAVLQELLWASRACPRSWRSAACLFSVLPIVLSLSLAFVGRSFYLRTPFSDVSPLQRRNSIRTS